MTQFTKILVPLDFSDHSTAAQETAVEIAKTFSAKIWLLHCYQLHPGGVSPYGIAAPASYHDDVRDAVMRQIRECQEKVEAEGVSAEASVSSEIAPQAIVEMAKDIGFNCKEPIHPKQIAALNEVFTLCKEKITRARRVTKIFEEADTGLAVIDGKLNEKPALRGMHRIFAIVERIGE